VHGDLIQQAQNVEEEDGKTLSGTVVITIRGRRGDLNSGSAEWCWKKKERKVSNG